MGMTTLPASPLRATTSFVSSVAEIEAAIESLPEEDRERLESWFIARRFGQNSALEQELDEAIAEADAFPEAGKSTEEVRTLIRQWASESSSKNGR